jgi:Glycosyl hydrolase family 76
VAADSVQRAWAALERAAFRPSRGGLTVAEDAGRRRRASLWTLINVLGAACDMVDLGRAAPLDELAAILERHRRGDAYSATPHGRRFYDDNAWLGLISLRLARTTGRREHRSRAEKVLAFVRSGEDQAGGVLWAEGTTARNTCSSAPAAWLALAADPKESRVFAGRVMDWLLSTLRRADDLFADRIEGGVVKQTVWSYNQGSSVAALRLLGRKEDAERTALASLELFQGSRRWREPPPFLAIWLRALCEDPLVNAVAIRSLNEHVDDLLRRALDESTGLFTLGGVGSYDGRVTIDQAATVQLLALREMHS